eukprot:776901-Prorocentrum_minimum.AAC.1
MMMMMSVSRGPVSARVRPQRVKLCCVAPFSSLSRKKGFLRSPPTSPQTETKSLAARKGFSGHPPRGNRGLTPPGKPARLIGFRSPF